MDLSFEKIAFSIESLEIMHLLLNSTVYLNMRI